MVYPSHLPPFNNLAGRDMNESAQTRKLCKELEALGVLVFAAVGNRYGKSGFPDRCLMHPGFPGGCVWVEFKAADGEVSPLQAAVHADMVKRGVAVFVITFHADGKGCYIVRSRDKARWQVRADGQAVLCALLDMSNVHKR